MNAKKLARLSLMTAVSFVLLFLACITPTGKLAVTAIAGLLAALAVIEGGLAGGCMVWAVTGALGFILLPVKNCALLFALFFGIYPVIKSLIERLKTLWLEWVLKLVFFNGILTLYAFGFKEFFAAQAAGIFKLLPVAYALGSVVFVLYDLGFSKLIAFYMSRKPKGGHK